MVEEFYRVSSHQNLLNNLTGSNAMAHFIFLLLSLIPALATALQFPGEDGPSELNTALYQNIMYMMAIRQYMSVMMHIPLDKKYWMGTFG
jgi:hypothetical protein